MGGTNIPNDINAEESLLGAMMLTPEAAMVGLEVCRVEDFYSSTNARIFAAITKLVKTGIPVDAITVASEMDDNHIIPKLAELLMNTPSSLNVRTYGAIVHKHSMSRSLMQCFSSSAVAIGEGQDPYQTATNITKIISNLGTSHSSEPQSMTLDELEMNADAIAPVVIPGMMNRDYRTVVVAEEGAGKSLLLRTIGMAASQGYHPFSHQRIRPVRVLVVDLENPTQAITQTAVPYMNMLRNRDEDGSFDTERLRFWRKPGGIDIRRLSDKAELLREIAFHRPELVLIGPIYKMYRRGANETYEDSADEAMAVLDELRTKYEFALVMEHHAAKGKSGERRDLSPMGSQRWMAWPEAGISLYKDTQDPTMLHVKRFRGDRLQGIDWPDTIMRDRTWLIEGLWNM